MHHHFSRDERVSLATLLREGLSQRTIAKHLGIHHSTVSRELSRNSSMGRYHASTAHRIATIRRTTSKHPSRILENNGPLANTVEALMDPLIAPECIAHLVGIHHQTIYAWIDRSRPDLKGKLPYRGKKRRRYGGNREKKQGWTQRVRSIDDRITQSINWEGDTIRGRSLARILTHVEQKSLYLRADLLHNGTADRVHAVLEQRPLFGSITYDRGSEFALWSMIEQDTGVIIYFAHPHHPWQRGKNENTNGRLRRVFPKHYDFATLSDIELQRTVTLMNNTPRKSLGWRTPAEVFNQQRCISR